MPVLLWLFVAFFVALLLWLEMPVLLWLFVAAPVHFAEGLGQKFPHFVDQGGGFTNTGGFAELG